MDKEELKQILKPLIKECIKEVMFESGVLSRIVSEVAVGLSSDKREVIKEVRKQKPAVRKERPEVDKRLNEYKKKFAEEVSKENYGGVDLFEGTTPLASGGTPGAPSAMGPMANIDPDDPGVDISGLMSQNGQAWKALAK